MSEYYITISTNYNSSWHGHAWLNLYAPEGKITRGYDNDGGKGFTDHDDKWASRDNSNESDRIYVTKETFDVIQQNIGNFQGSYLAPGFHPYKDNRYNCVTAIVEVLEKSGVSLLLEYNSTQSKYLKASKINPLYIMLPADLVSSINFDITNKSYQIKNAEQSTSSIGGISLYKIMIAAKNSLRALYSQEIDRIGSIGRDKTYTVFYDPLTIDLNGNGKLDVIGTDSGINFDFNGDGLAGNTGWVGKEDGILVFDDNQDGKVICAEIIRQLNMGDFP
ncbi:hypothetical protein [Wohlfahrtiimonas chitiniclastica]|uniref:hypothetical protein n=1 Tax=Wohlfahrtiimonas chitiniclastica TaxID=400946 RepID=UPI0021588E8F|nr:hypothetical protein [Wohlfahrtiimonas chitiniclastica]MDC7253085.1 hypothetical protein [Wohlfahrtiimonas chitiniclastica]